MIRGTGLRLRAVDAGGYCPHPPHVTQRTWTETELLHALWFDPLAAAGFTLSTGFEGDQWTFFESTKEM